MHIQEWKIFALGSAMFAALTAILAKMGLRGISSNFATLIRTLVVALLISCLIWFRREWRNPFALDKESLVFLVLSGLATGLSWLCYFRALQTGPASLVSSIDKSGLFFAVILSILFLGERLNLYEWFGAFLVLIGTLILVWK